LKIICELKVAWSCCKFLIVLKGVLRRPHDGAGSIYFLSSAGTLYSVDNAGHLKWKIPRLGTIKEINVPAIAPDGTIVAVGDQFLHAISADGRQLWRREVHYVNSPPLIDAGGNIYLAYHVTAPERITCYTIAGVLKWRITGLPNVSIIGGTPLGPDGILIFGSENDELLYALH